MQISWNAALLAATAIALVPQAALAQSGTPEEITVIGSRLPADLSSVPGSVTVVTLEDISKQRGLTSDLGQILAQTVPGYGVASFGTQSNFDTTLRGRKPAVFLDGVPMTDFLRDGAHDLRSVAASAIGRVEVIRGSTSIYGLGGAGGIINFVSKTPGEGKPEFETRIGSSLSLTHPGDSLNYNVEQGASGRFGRFSYVVGATFEKYSTFYDADGDARPPDPGQQGGLGDNRIYSIYGKLGYDITDNQSLQFSVNDFRAEMFSDYTTLNRLVAGNYESGVFGVSKVRPILGKAPGESNEFTQSFVTSANYLAKDVLGSSVNVVGYYAKGTSMFALSNQLTLPTEPLGQSYIKSQRKGVRLDIRTPLQVLAGGQLLWGADYGEDKAVQPLTGPTIRILTPLIDASTKAGFGQLELDVVSWLKLRGGIRYEKVDLDIPTFTTTPALGGRTIRGGQKSFSKAVYNAGAVVNFNEHFSSFVSFSQGFSFTDIGRVIRQSPTNSIDAFEADAQVINNYEVGLRANYGPIKATLATYVSKSKLGSTYNALTLQIVQAKEKVWGVEATIEATINDSLKFGGSFDRTDGKRDTNADGRIDTRLDTTRINPMKITGYVEYEARPKWLTRLQVLYSGAQNRFPDDLRPTFGRGPVDSFVTLDLTTTFPVGPGELTLGVQNLLNENYFPPSSLRSATGATYSPAVGAMAQASYRIRY